MDKIPKRYQPKTRAAVLEAWKAKAFEKAERDYQRAAKDWTKAQAAYAGATERIDHELAAGQAEFDAFYDTLVTFGAQAVAGTGPKRLVFGSTRFLGSIYAYSDTLPPFQGLAMDVFVSEMHRKGYRVTHGTEHIPGDSDSRGDDGYDEFWVAVDD